MADLTWNLYVELAGVGGGWTSILADVRQADGVKASYGIMGSEPGDRVAETGTLTFSLDNSAANSGGLLGYYSPLNDNCRAGWGLGIRVQLTIRWPNAITYYKFVGWVDSITPVAGQHGVRSVAVTAVDWIDHAASWKMTGLATVTNKRADEVLATLVAAVPVQPVATSLGTGSDTYSYALDVAGSGQGSALAEMQRIALSEWGYIYVRGDISAGGLLVFEPRTARLTATPTYTANDDILRGAQLSMERAAVLNRVWVTVTPRTVDSSPVVLYTLQNKPLLAAGESVTIEARYVDPSQKAASVGGTSMVPPVATTDYTANTQEDGGGVDMTASLTVTPTFGGDGAKLVLLNTHGATALYVTLLQLRGLGLYSYEQVSAEATDAASITAYGERTCTVDMPYQSSLAIAKGVAAYILEARKDPHAHGITLSFRANASDDAMTLGVASDIGDAIEVGETVSGLKGAYWLNGVELAIGEAGVLDVTWHLSRGSMIAYWRLDDVGFRLGSNTRLSPL